MVLGSWSLRSQEHSPTSHTTAEILSSLFLSKSPTRTRTRGETSQNQTNLRQAKKVVNRVVQKREVEKVVGEIMKPTTKRKIGKELKLLTLKVSLALSTMKKTL